MNGPALRSGRSGVVRHVPVMHSPDVSFYSQEQKATLMRFKAQEGLKKDQVSLETRHSCLPKPLYISCLLLTCLITVTQCPVPLHKRHPVLFIHFFPPVLLKHF